MREKFHELDTDNDGLLTGDDINQLVTSTWSNFKPGGREFQKDQIETEAEKLRNVVDKMGHVDGVVVSGGEAGLDRDQALDFAEFAAYFRTTAETVARFHNRFQIHHYDHVEDHWKPHTVEVTKTIREKAYAPTGPNAVETEMKIIERHEAAVAAVVQETPDLTPEEHIVIKIK